MDLYANGMWCFYSISANGQGVGFNHLLDTAPYNTNTYPNLLPNTNKFSSEWRVTTICNIFNGIGYNPRININNTSLGPIKYYPGPDPGNAFPVNNVFPTEVWCEYDPGSPANFFSTTLWGPGGDEWESAQGVAGSGADQYAPAGWYGTSAENSYAYWDGFGNWSGYATYGGGTSYTKFLLLGPFGDPEMACSETADRVEYNTVFTDNVSTGPTTGKTVYGDSAGSSLANLMPMMWYKVFDENFNSLNYTITVDPGMIIDNQSSCR
jgi:hypothetical protein